MASPTSWISEVMDGAREFFTADAGVKPLIGKRFYEVAAEEWIATLETNQGEKSPRAGMWASYRPLSSPVAQALSRQSGFRKLFLEIACYGFVPAKCRALFDAFYSALATGTGNSENRFNGTWNGHSVQAVRFDLETVNGDYDESFRQAVMSCTLMITLPNG